MAQPTIDDLIKPPTRKLGKRQNLEILADFVSNRRFASGSRFHDVKCGNIRFRKSIYNDGIIDWRSVDRPRLSRADREDPGESSPSQVLRSKIPGFPSGIPTQGISVELTNDPETINVVPFAGEKYMQSISISKRLHSEAYDAITNRIEKDDNWKCWNAWKAIDNARSDGEPESQRAVATERAIRTLFAKPVTVPSTHPEFGKLGSLIQKKLRGVDISGITSWDILKVRKKYYVWPSNSAQTLPDEADPGPLDSAPTNIKEQIKRENPDKTMITSGIVSWGMKFDPQKPHRADIGFTSSDLPSFAASLQVVAHRQEQYRATSLAGERYSEEALIPGSDWQKDNKIEIQGGSDNGYEIFVAHFEQHGLTPQQVDRQALRGRRAGMGSSYQSSNSSLDEYDRLEQPRSNPSAHGREKKFLDYESSVSSDESVVSEKKRGALRSALGRVFRSSKKNEIEWETDKDEALFRRGQEEYRRRRKEADRYSSIGTQLHAPNYLPESSRRRDIDPFASTEDVPESSHGSYTDPFADPVNVRHPVTVWGDHPIAKASGVQVGADQKITFDIVGPSRISALVTNADSSEVGEPHTIKLGELGDKGFRFVIDGIQRSRGRGKAPAVAASDAGIADSTTDESHASRDPTEAPHSKVHYGKRRAAEVIPAGEASLEEASHFARPLSSLYDPAHEGRSTRPSNPEVESPPEAHAVTPDSSRQGGLSRLRALKDGIVGKYVRKTRNVISRQ